MTTDLFAFLSGFALKLYGGTTVAGYTRFRMDNSDDQTVKKFALNVVYFLMI